MRILVTGGTGFIGHHLVEHLLESSESEIVVLDRLDASGNLNRLSDIPNWEVHKTRVNFLWHDLKAPLSEHLDKEIGSIDHVIHLAASSHVDRSIEDPVLFAMDNVVGTTNLLNWARGKNIKLFVNFSTDEVFGPAPVGYAHKEHDSHYPSNPYSASKSGQEAMGYAFFVTYGLPVINTHTMNNFGERQHPEKLIPKTIRSVIRGEEMPIFAAKNGKGEWQAVGTRFWLDAKNTASAVSFLLEHGTPGETYNIIGFDELSNLEVAEKVAGFIGKPLKAKLVDFHKTRPGHDMRYALDGSKLRTMGWQSETNLDEGLKRVVDFTVANPRWL